MMIIPILCDFLRKGLLGKFAVPVKWLGILLMFIGSFVDVDSAGNLSGSDAMYTGAIMWMLAQTFIDFVDIMMLRDTKVQVKISEAITLKMYEMKNLVIYIIRVLFVFFANVSIGSRSWCG